MIRHLEDSPLPPLVTHIVSASRSAEQLAGAHLSESGEFLLGATTPDIRVLTRWDRAQTHFFDLETEEHQDSVCGFFDAHPRLRESAVLSEATRAWTCGYLAHLVMDQEYITSVYRPHFGRRSVLGGDDRANLLDRVLQYEFDRREREDQGRMHAVRQLLFASALDIDAGFIDRETLESWRDTTASITEHAPDWDRFSFIAARHLRRAGVDSAGGFDQFMQQVPEMLDETLRHVDQAAMDAFFETVNEKTAAQLREYLGVA